MRTVDEGTRRLADLVPGRAERSRLRAQVEDLREQLDAREAELATLRARVAAPAGKAPGARPAAGTSDPSYAALLGQHKALIAASNRVGERRDHPLLKVPFKLQNNALAASHGVPVPGIHRVWPSLSDFDLTDPALPDGIVVKSDSGTNGRSVFPLRREDHPDTWSLVDGSRTFSTESLRDAMGELGEKALSPYLVEDLLASVDESPVPDDIKVYCAYGVATQILLIRPAADGVTDRARVARRYLGPTGADLGEVVAGVTYDHGIPVPARLTEIVAAARHLSRAVGIPFCRVDFFETPTGFAFGEITRTPGGSQRYTVEHDLVLGEAWLDAQARLNRDLQHGRPPGILYGDRQYTWHYPDHPNPRRPNRWERRHVACAEWCDVDRD